MRWMNQQAERTTPAKSAACIALQEQTPRNLFLSQERERETEYGAVREALFVFVFAAAMKPKLILATETKGGATRRSGFTPVPQQIEQP